MAWLQLIKAARALFFTSFAMAPLLPNVAWAGWADENWGEMVWGAGAPQVPALPTEGIVALAALLLGLSYWLLAARRRRSKRPLLNS